MNDLMRHQSGQSSMGLKGLPFPHLLGLSLPNHLILVDSNEYLLQLIPQTLFVMSRSSRESRRLSGSSHESQDIPVDDSPPRPQVSGDQEIEQHSLSTTASLTSLHDGVNDPLPTSTQEHASTHGDSSSSTTVPVNSPPTNQNILRPKFGPGAVAMLLLAIYSAALSGVWFVVAIIQPRWGFKISTTHGLSPSNAATLTALLGKTIEIASITVFISCIGQALTRRAAAEKSTGITLADITIRNWIIQPGSIFTHHHTLAIAGRTILGALALLGLVVTILYTTASQALVSPKLKYGQWESREMTAPVHSFYGNHVDAGARCTRKRKPDPIKNPNYPGDKAIYKDMALLCLGHELSYKSTRDLLAFKGLGSDATIGHTGKDETPLGTAGHTLLHDKVIMEATRVNTEFRDVAALYERWGRIVDNVTVSIPHPGVWSASRFPENKILQPEDLSNVGGFYMKAAVVSPTLNILCVNMDEDEIAPLVYAEFPHGEKEGFERWAGKEVTKWDNSTVVDDVFRWGSEYGRRRPIFESVSFD